MIDPYILIAKELASIITLDETVLLEEWRNKSAENEEVYQDMRESWFLINASSHWVMPDKRDTWNEIEYKINNLDQSSVKTYTKATLIKMASIAASIALIVAVGISFVYQYKMQPSEQIVQVNTPRGQKSEIVLPDGSKVWLNSGSSLSYSTDYGRDSRTVGLYGEAFFDVAPNKEILFNVLLDGGLKVQVHGTQFNVDAYPGTKDITVSLLEGSVSLLTDTPDAEKNAIMLKPNEKIVMNKETYTYKQTPCDAELESLWRLGRLKIEQATLAQIVEKMERWYGVDIHMKGNDRGKLYWLTIKTESLTEMLELINKITPINYSIKGEEVTIQYR
ncbi:FecR family protein [Dysgonomonas capnocytophagoides]|uniref:FecR family protein n=1 Tax=Dysgonomonas capnocytophagoides TaxID=45254 RepID=UPI0033422850